MTAVAMNYAKGFLNVGLRGGAALSFGLEAAAVFECVCRLAAMAKVAFNEKGGSQVQKDNKSKEPALSKTFQYCFRPMRGEKELVKVVGIFLVTGFVGIAASELAYLVGQPDAFNAGLKWVSPFQMGPGRFPLTQSVLDLASRAISWIRG